MSDSYATPTTVGNTSMCCKCRTTYICYGVAMEWTWVNGRGPYCGRCMKDGVTANVTYTEVTE